MLWKKNFIWLPALLLPHESAVEDCDTVEVELTGPGGVESGRGVNEELSIEGDVHGVHAPQDPAQQSHTRVLQVRVTRQVHSRILKGEEK